jgi:adenylate kinase family enzyme
VIHIRSGNNNEVKNSMIKSLASEHGFVHLDVEQCVRGEAERGTMIGKELSDIISTSNVPSAELISKMLNRILYCGKESMKKFILSSYPGTIE